MNRRLMLSTMLAGGAMTAFAPAALGADEWCIDDPPVHIQTPTGHKLTVHITNYALGDHDQALKIVHDNPLPPYITYTVDPARVRGGNGGPDKGRDRDRERDDDDDDRESNRKSKGKATAIAAAPATRAKQSWDVTIWVLIPGHPIPGDAPGPFKVKAVASTGINATGTILARDQGWADDLMQLKFTITD